MAFRQEQILAGYSRWANELIYGVVARLPAEAVSAPRDMAFGSLLQTLGHSYAVAAIFQAHLLSRAHGFRVRRVSELTTFYDLRALQRDLDDWYVAWIDQTPDSTLEQLLRFEFLDGSAGMMTRREIFLHAVNHHTYHRGALTEALRRMSVVVPSSDLSTYCCSRRAPKG